MLTTSNPYSQRFLDKRRIFLDSGVLIAWAKDAGVRNVMHMAQLNYSLVLCTLSILEVGLGPSKHIEPKENSMAMDIYSHENITACEAINFAVIDAEGRTPPPGAAFSLNPGHHEWLMARSLLIKAMTEVGTRSRRLDELRNDAVLYASAWNSRSVFITNNPGDFILLNKHQSSDRADRLLPIYSVDDLYRSLQGEDVSFPENLQSVGQ
jgi:hypothetical protein